MISIHCILVYVVLLFPLDASCFRFARVGCVVLLATEFAF